MPDRRVAWAATEGATNAGAVTFEYVGGGQTSVQLSLEYEPEGLLERSPTNWNVQNQAEKDLERSKAFIEAECPAAGAWRGSVNEDAPVGSPGVEAAAASRGDAGKAGVSGAAVGQGGRGGGSGRRRSRRDDGEEVLRRQLNRRRDGRRHRCQR